MRGAWARVYCVLWDGLRRRGLVFVFVKIAEALCAGRPGCTGQAAISGNYNNNSSSQAEELKNALWRMTQYKSLAESIECRGFVSKKFGRDIVTKDKIENWTVHIYPFNQQTDPFATKRG
jgi:hypothetical protein